ncbi:MAG: Chromate transporter, partial [Planctomycetota bacterium]
MANDTPEEPAHALAGRFRPIFLSFLAFGVRAFGGPAAQIAELRSEFIDRRAWTT